VIFDAVASSPVPSPQKGSAGVGHRTAFGPGVSG